MNPTNIQPQPLQPISNPSPQQTGGGKKLIISLIIGLIIVVVAIFVYSKYMQHQNTAEEANNFMSEQSDVSPEVADSSTEQVNETSNVKLQNYGLNSTEGVPWLKGKTISNSPETKAKLAEKYKQLWSAFNEKNTQKVLGMINAQLESYAEATGDSSIKARAVEDLETRFASKSYSLYPIQEALDNAELVIAANGKLATLLIENEYSPIFYIRKNPEGTVSYSYYFMLNDSNEFVPIYNASGLENL